MGHLSSLDGTPLSYDDLDHHRQVPTSNCVHKVDVFNQTSIPQLNELAPNQSCFHQPDYQSEPISRFYRIGPESDSPTPDSHSEHLRQDPCEDLSAEKTEQLNYDPELFTDEIPMPHHDIPFGKFIPGN